MIEEISDDVFVDEMRILWQNVDVETRNKLAEMIDDYFDEGQRAEKIINKMQEKREDGLKNG